MNDELNERAMEAALKFSAKKLAEGYRLEALHTYTDAQGEPQSWRIRLKHPSTGKKEVLSMCFDGEAFHARGAPTPANGKPLYRLHGITQAPSDSPVLVVEGEWCADKLAALGLTVTTSGGQSTANGADWTPLAGRYAVLWPDFDRPGFAYADAVRARLEAVGCACACIDVAALDLPEKGDAVDWLALHPQATASDVLNLLCLPVEEQSDGWPAPEPLAERVPPEPYPLHALPDDIRLAVEEVTAFVQAPVAMVASSALGALSLACQAHADVQRAEKLHGPSGLFLLTIADSGERKTTCDQFFTKPIHEYQERQAEAAKPALKDFKASLNSWAAVSEGVLGKIRTLAKSGKPTTEQEKELRALEERKPEPPKVPRLVYTDATPEALAFSLAKKWPSGGVVSAEAGIVFGSHGMGKESVMRNLGLLNQLWDGKPLTIDRKASESFTVNGVRLTVYLQVQEPTLREFFAKSGALARGTGFLARFLVAWPESTQGARPFADAPKHWPNLARFNRRIDAILEAPASLDAEGGLLPEMLTLTPQAKALWVEFHDGIERELCSGGELYDVRDVASKSADNAARIAALFQSLEGLGQPISATSFERASRIAAWHLHESRRFFGELALPAEMADAGRVDGWLIQHCKQMRTGLVSTRDAQRLGPVRDKEKLREALRELEGLNRVRLLEEGRRRAIEVNPALLVTP